MFVGRIVISSACMAVLTQAAASLTEQNALAQQNGP